MADKWQTVSRAKKAPSKLPKLNGKDSEKKYIDVISGPVIEEKSPFDVLNPKEKRDKNSNSGGNSDNSTDKSKSSIPLPAKTNVVKKAAKPTLESILSGVTKSQYEEEFRKAKELFKDKPLMCLKALATRLNSSLCDVSDPLYSEQADDYPACLLDESVKQVFRKSIKECSEEMLHIFMDELINTVNNEMTKGIPVHGYQIVAQILAREKTHLFSSNLKKILDLIIANKNSVQRCQAMLWIIGQGGLVDFRTGLKVWTNVMLHLLGVKTLALHAVTYLERILKQAGSNVENGYGVIEVKDFFLLLDGVFSNNSSLQPPIQKRLRECYPLLKELTFGRSQEKIASKCFPSFLTRVVVDKSNDALQSEVLANIVKCVLLDSTCFTIWTEIYSKHLLQSSFVLNNLADRLLNGEVSYLHELPETIAAFHSKNAELKSSTVGLNECKKACQRFDEFFTLKAAESISTTKYVLLLCLFGVAALIGFDCFQSGGFQGSKTRTLLRESGIDVIAAKVFSYLYENSCCIRSYMSSNLPKLVDSVIFYVEPTVSSAWQAFVAAVQYCVVASEPARQWIAKNVPQYVDWVIMHPFWGVLYEETNAVLTFLQPYIEICNNYINQARISIVNLLS